MIVQCHWCFLWGRKSAKDLFGIRVHQWLRGSIEIGGSIFRHSCPVPPSRSAHPLPTFHLPVPPKASLLSGNDTYHCVLLLDIWVLPGHSADWLWPFHSCCMFTDLLHVRDSYCPRQRASDADRAQDWAAHQVRYNLAASLTGLFNFLTCISCTHGCSHTILKTNRCMHLNFI